MLNSRLKWTVIRPSSKAVAFLVFVILTCISSSTLAEDPSSTTADLEVLVVYEGEDIPVDNATVEVVAGEKRTKQVTDFDGRAQFTELPPGLVSLHVEHHDYESSHEEIAIDADRTNKTEIQLKMVALELDEVVVTTTGHRVGAQHIYRPTTRMEGDELQRNLSSSVPETLDSVPGFGMEYNGPGAASPTIRGMPGDRVLMLEDGHPTGDIYWTAADHGVMVEPLSAERMDVVRGPASLLYGSSSLGGVVNVIREDIPRFQPSQVEGAASTRYESVNDGISGGAVLRGPLGPLAFFAEATARRAGDTQTPLGVIDRTGLQAFNTAAGLSHVGDSSVLGASFRFYDNVYDIPGEFDGELIPGGHPGGVTSEARKLSGRVLAEYNEPVSVFDNIEFRSSAVQFSHDEIERIIDDEPVIGASFEQLSTDTQILAQHRRLGSEKQGELYAEGALGVSLQSRDLTTGGAAPGSRSGAERAFGIYGFEEIARDPFRLQTGLRYDYRHVTTSDLSDIRVNTRERVIVKPVEPRSFHAISASLSGLWSFVEGWTLGTTFARSFRNPTIEEMYSDGPHLADFSFDIGTPDLESEIGHGVDVFLRGEHSRLKVESALYYNRVDDYIYYNPTGETVRVFREGAPPRTTPVFEAQGDDAHFLGGEGRVEWQFVDDFIVDVGASYTWATRRDDGDPLPFIPPLSGRAELRYDGDPLFASIGSQFAAPQNRVPRPVQIGDSSEDPMQPTEGYVLAHAMLGWRYAGQSTDHTVMIQARNATDRDWRDHLSRIKDIAPQPGRDIRLSYRVLF